MTFILRPVVVKTSDDKSLPGAEMDAGRFLFSFRGRVNRAGYWIFVAVAFFYVLQLAGVGFHVMRNNVGRDIAGLLFFAIALFLIPLIVATFAVSARRLHDCDLSAWWLVVFLVVPAVLGGVSEIFVARASEDTALSIGLQLISTVVSTWGFVQLACLRGTSGPNRYGADPLAVAAQA